MYLISIYFNEETERKLKNIIQHIANETGNTFMLDNQVPPHMTVAAVETKHEDVLVARMDELVKRLQNEFMPMDARVVRIGIAKTNPHRDMKLWELQER